MNGASIFSKRQSVRRGTQPLPSEVQQKPERVPIGPYRMRADALLLHEPLCEEPLQEHREGRQCEGHAEASQ
jgi:hypothetical protein